MNAVLWGTPARKVMARLTLWRANLFLFRHQTSDSRVRGMALVRTAATESGDLRTLCVNLARVFGQLLHADEAEIEIYSNTPIDGFTVVWTASQRQAGESSDQSTSVPLAVEGNRMGALRLRRTSKPFNLAESRELIPLALEAARHIQIAIHIANTVEAAVMVERSRLAAQIHHGTAQYVANALMRLHLCHRYIAQDPERAEELVHNALTFTQMAMDAVRATIHSLQYVEEDTPRIATFLRATTERLRSITSAEFHLDLDPVSPLSPTIETAIAAIAEEALTNAAKHADAQNIYVRLTKASDTITFEVSDDGSGFTFEEGDLNSRSWERFGLTLMRDQAHRLGGTIQVQSVPSGGTQVKVQIPANLHRPVSFHTAAANAGHRSRPLGTP